jgi:hypothetical protein
MMEQMRIETSVTSYSEWLTEYDSTSAAPASAFPSKELVAGHISSSGTVAAAHVALVSLLAAFLVIFEK